MRSRRIWWLAAGATAIAATGCTTAAGLAGQGPALIQDPARARAIMPAIIAYLESPAYRQRGPGEYSTADYQAGRVKWLCSAALVEVRPDGGGGWREWTSRAATTIIMVPACTWKMEGTWATS
jgi:hypothetical protein